MFDPYDTCDIPPICERCGRGQMVHYREKYGADADGHRYVWIEYDECTYCEWNGIDDYVKCDECGCDVDWCECEKEEDGECE